MLFLELQVQFKEEIILVIIQSILFIIVYTYGIGTIGALGHNDYNDREYPEVVEFVSN